MTVEQIEAIGRAIATVEFIEPCPRCARRERLALARLILAEFTPEEGIEILTGSPVVLGEAP